MSSRRTRAILILITLLVISYGTVVLVVAQQSTDIGIRCAFETDIHRVSPEYFPADLNPGRLPRVDDRLVQIGGSPVQTWSHFVRTLSDIHDVRFFKLIEVPEAADLAALNHLAAAQSEPFIVVRGETELVEVRYLNGETGELSVAWCEIGHPPALEMLQSLVWFVLKLGLFGLAVAVLWNRHRDAGTWRFFLLCTVTICAFVGGYHWFRIAGHPLLVIVFMGCALMLPVVSLQFYLNFPTPKQFLQRYPRSAAAALYAVPVALFIGMLATYLVLVWTYRRADGAASQETVLFLLSALLTQVFAALAVSAVLFAGCVVSLIHSYFTTLPGTKERNQVTWILAGALLASLPISYALYLAATATDQFGVGGAAWPMFLASLCITLGYGVSISRYGLMEIGQVLNLNIVSVGVSLAAGVVYSLLVFLGTLLIGTRIEHLSAFKQAAWVSLTAWLLLMCVDLFRWRLRKAIDRAFHRDKYQLEKTLHRMSQTVDQMVDPPALCLRLLHAVSDVLDVQHGAVYLRDAEAAIWRRAAYLGPEPPLAELAAGSPLIRSLEQSPLVRVRSGGMAEAAQRQLRELLGDIAVPLRYEGSLLALLTVGPPRSGDFGPEELHLLTSFARVAVLALHGARGHQTIAQLRGELQNKVEKISEQQRRIGILQSQLLRVGMGELKETVKTSDVAAADETRAAAAPSANGEIVGSSPIMKDLLRMIQKVGSSNSAVLIRGESGTGKELLARALHDHSLRAEKAFVKVHCAALSPGLLESELFGHVRGAFTGALKDKIGRFELADGGTLFLDEIGDISLDVQTKLLRVLQEMTFERVGSSEPVKVDVRIIAATNQDLERLMREGRFRQDLFYRLNVITITTPALRERRDDIYELALHFLQLHSRQCGKSLVNIDDDALELLKAYDWPGNVRELENVIERAVVLADTPYITVRELPAALRELDPAGLALSRNGGGAGRSEPAPDVEPEDWEAAREEQERGRLVRALAAAEGNKSRAARALRMPRSTFLSKLEKHGLIPKRIKV